MLRGTFGNIELEMMAPGTEGGLQFYNQMENR